MNQPEFTSVQINNKQKHQCHNFSDIANILDFSLLKQQCWRSNYQRGV